MMHLSLHLFVGSEVASTTIASPSTWALETRGKRFDDMLPETRGSRIGKTCFLMYGRQPLCPVVSFLVSFAATTKGEGIAIYFA